VDGRPRWLLGAALYVSEEWLTRGAKRARIPAAIRFQEKMALRAHVAAPARAAGFQVTAVLDDAEFGDNATLRRTRGTGCGCRARSASRRC
jgi:SRSO17 transposase